MLFQKSKSENTNPGTASWYPGEGGSGLPAGLSSFGIGGNSLDLYFRFIPKGAFDKSKIRSLDLINHAHFMILTNRLGKQFHKSVRQMKTSGCS